MTNHDLVSDANFFLFQTVSPNPQSSFLSEQPPRFRIFYHWKKHYNRIHFFIFSVIKSKRNSVYDRKKTGPRQAGPSVPTPNRRFQAPAPHDTSLHISQESVIIARCNDGKKRRYKQSLARVFGTYERL